MTYNGWKNYSTWNVWLWISNDPGYYWFAAELAGQASSEHGLYRRFVDCLDLHRDLTPDGVHFLDSGLDYEALDRYMFDLSEHDI